MDQTTTQGQNRRSQIPRLSRLPVPRTGLTNALRPSPSREKLAADPGVPVNTLRSPHSRDSLSASTRPRAPADRRSISGFRKVSPGTTSPSRSSVAEKKKNEEFVFKKPTLRPPSRQQNTSRPSSRQQNLSRPSSRQQNCSRPPSSQSGRYGIEGEGIADGPSQSGFDVFDEESNQEMPSIRRHGRPSLSERTMETISQVPPSPSSRRRRSSFFSGESPMRPPSRPASAMSNNSRSGSSLGNYLGTGRQPARPASPTKAPAVPKSSSVRPRPSLPTMGKRNVSSSYSRGSFASSLKPGQVPSATPNRSQYSGTDTGLTARPASAASNQMKKTSPLPKGSKSMMIRPPRSRPSLNGLFGNLPKANVSPAPSEPRSADPSPVVSPRSSNTSVSGASAKRSPKPLTPSKPPTPSKSLTPSKHPTPAVEARKTSNSSSALRETIAKAKAARRSAGRKSLANTVAEDGGANGVNSGFDFEFDTDPFNQGLSNNKGLLRKRIDAARTDGRLNISAMGLKEVPEEVMKMYNLESVEADSGAWYESVDLVRFLAADNEISEFPSNVFPDYDPREGTNPEDEEQGNIFGGVENIDLHGNLLKAVPLGLRRLERLTILNISNNQLDNDVFTVISQIPTLHDLRLANNNLSDELPPELGHLSDLEVLDLHGNKISALPSSINELLHLRNLNVAENELTTIPFEALSELPLSDLNISKNKLSGTLIPASVTKLAFLQSFNITGNSLTALTASGTLDLPALQSFLLSYNRIASFPNMSTWTQLLTLAAEDNKIPSIPEGFTSLPKIRNVDFAGNDLTSLDEHIGQMESLEIFRIGNNPLRERKFLTMITDDLKRDLRNRLAPAQKDEAATEGSVADEEDQYHSARSTPEPTQWQIKQGGVLDLSGKDLDVLDDTQIAAISTSENTAIRSLILHHNLFSAVPTASLSLFAAKLTTLNLAHNKLRADDYLAHPLSLPCLQYLDLSANSLSSLDPLLTHLDSPSLVTLNVSANRLSSLPILRSRFPALVAVLAADNSIGELTVEMARGLRQLVLSGNDIAQLPPKLGLLEGELKVLEVGGNRFKVPRYTILELGTDAVLAWLRGRIPVDELDDALDGDGARGGGGEHGVDVDVGLASDM
ncbi:MAG: hypothetical protein M1819_003775 [Sarea resinae]|nr:MAG: hypothetical protein M1819_003775 [Sarea resinae]